MKTLKEIKETGDIKAYMNALGDSVTQILPSIDGSETKRCHFILCIGDDSGDVDVCSSEEKDRWIEMLEAVIAALKKKYPPQKPGKLTLRRGDLHGS